MSATRCSTPGGALKLAPCRSSAVSPFFTYNSDSIWVERLRGRTLKRMTAAWDDTAMDCLMLLAPTFNAIGFEGKGDFTMDSNGAAEAARGGGASRRSRGPACRLFIRGSIARGPDGAFSTNKLWDIAIEEGAALRYPARREVDAYRDAGGQSRGRRVHGRRAIWRRKFGYAPDQSLHDSTGCSLCRRTRARGAWRAIGQTIRSQLSRALILLPTRRSIRALGEAFARVAPQPSFAVLPRMRALGDFRRCAVAA